MKGNEARVVIFLHPVDQVKDGKVAKVEPLKNSVGIISLLLLALLLGIGVLIYLFLTLEADPSQPEPVSSTEASSTTNEQRFFWEELEVTTTATKTSTMNEPVTTGSTEVTSEKPGENKSSTESGKIV